MSDSPISRYFEPVRRWWWIVAATILVAVLGAVITLPEQVQLSEEELFAQAAQFRATNILIRNPEQTSALPFELIQLLAQQGELTNRVVDRLGDQVTAGEVEAVELVTDPNIGTLSITVVQDMPEDALRLSEVYTEELISFLDERAAGDLAAESDQVRREVEQLEASIDALQSEIAGLAPGATDRAVLEAEVQVQIEAFAVARARQSTLESQIAGLAPGFTMLQPPSPVPVIAEDDGVVRLPADPVRRVMGVTLLALVVGIILALVVDALDTRIRTRRDAEEAFGLPVIAELPARGKREREKDVLPIVSDPTGVTAEVMRTLALTIELAPTWHLVALPRDGDSALGTKTPENPDGPPKTLVVTSPLTGDGKSTLVANLAASLAEGGKQVLIVDCDFRRPAVGSFLEATNGPGLRDLADVRDRPMDELMTETSAPNVKLVRSGSRGVTPPWFRAQVGELVALAKKEADIVIFDTGPITLTNEASAIIPHVDTSILVLRAGRVANDQALGTVEQLTQVGARVSGIVLVGSEGRRRYGYGYYATTEPDREERPSVEA